MPTASHTKGASLTLYSSSCRDGGGPRVGVGPSQVDRADGASRRGLCASGRCAFDRTCAGGAPRSPFSASWRVARGGIPTGRHGITQRGLATLPAVRPWGPEGLDMYMRAPVPPVPPLDGILLKCCMAGNQNVRCQVGVQSLCNVRSTSNQVKPRSPSCAPPARGAP